MPSVDVRRRFVGQKQFRLISQGSRHGHALLFADRELDGLCEADFPVRHDPTNAVPDRPHSAGRKRHPQKHIFQRREPRQQVERLKHVANFVGPKPVAPGFRKPRNIGAVNRIWPSSGRLMPAIRCNSVVFPEPLRPTSTICSPAATTNCPTSRIGSRPPPGSMNDFLTRSRVSIFQTFVLKAKMGESDACVAESAGRLR